MKQQQQQHLGQCFVFLRHGFCLSQSALPLLSHFQHDGDFSHVSPTSLTCSSLSSSAMVPYVCQNVYAVCFFQPDLFPCLLSNEPRSPRGSEPKPHAICTEWTAGALPAIVGGVGRVGGVQSMGEEIIRNFRFNQALEMSSAPSLSSPPLYFALAFVSFSLGCLQPNKVRSCPVQVICWTNTTLSSGSCLLFSFPSVFCVFLFSFHSFLVFNFASFVLIIIET